MLSLLFRRAGDPYSFPDHYSASFMKHRSKETTSEWKVHTGGLVGYLGTLTWTTKRCWTSTDFSFKLYLSRCLHGDTLKICEKCWNVGFSSLVPGTRSLDLHYCENERPRLKQGKVLCLYICKPSFIAGCHWWHCSLYVLNKHRSRSRKARILILKMRSEKMKFTIV